MRVIFFCLLDCFSCTGSTGATAKEIPLPNMRGNVVAKVVDFCRHNRADPMTEIPKVIPRPPGLLQSRSRQQNVAVWS